MPRHVLIATGEVYVIWFLIGFRNCIAVLLDRAWAYWSLQRYARIVRGKKAI